jgi:hypothetical protein
VATATGYPVNVRKTQVSLTIIMICFRRSFSINLLSINPVFTTRHFFHWLTKAKCSKALRHRMRDKTRHKLMSFRKSACPHDMPVIPRQSSLSAELTGSAISTQVFRTPKKCPVVNLSQGTWIALHIGTMIMVSPAGELVTTWSRIKNTRN